MRKLISFEDVVNAWLLPMFGQRCCRQRVGQARSLTIGFGNPVFHKKKIHLVDEFRGEWEIGTYSADWRVVRKAVQLCSRNDVIESSLIELDEKLNRIQLGAILSLEFVSEQHIRAQLTDEVSVDFLAPHGEDEDDAFFHVFAPDDIFIAYSLSQGWFVETDG